MEIGKMISKLRKEMGLNQRDFAKCLGVSSGAIGMWETGKRQPDLETIKKIASFFNVTIDYLLGNDKANNTFQAENETQGENFFFFFFDNENTTQSNFTNRIKTAISDNGLTEETFKNQISFGKEKAAAFLNGSCQPTADDLIELSRFLNTSIDYLLGQTPKIGRAEKKLLDAFTNLDTDNQDIIIGKTKELLKEQRSESVAADEPLKKTGTTNSAK